MSSSNATPETPAQRAIWDYLSKHARVTHADLKQHLDVTDWCRTNYLAKLKRLGVLRECDRNGAVRVFTILDEKAAMSYAAKKRDTTSGALWTAMRVFNTFTQPELQNACEAARGEIPDRTVSNYCSMLLTAGYLTVIEKARPGRRPARYKLVKNTGPLPPVIKSLQGLMDPNESRVVYVRGVEL